MVENNTGNDDNPKGTSGSGTGKGPKSSNPTPRVQASDLYGIWQTDRSAGGESDFARAFFYEDGAYERWLVFNATRRIIKHKGSFELQGRELVCFSEDLPNAPAKEVFRSRIYFYGDHLVIGAETYTRAEE